MECMTILNKSPIEILDILREAYGEEAMGRDFVYRWRRKFQQGMRSVEDRPRSGRPSVITEKAVDTVRAIVCEDRRVTIEQIAERMDISKSTVHLIIRERLQLSKLSARWVPHQLSEEHRRRRVEDCTALLKMYRRWGKRFISRIVTGDETWVSYSTPETKQQSKQWLPRGSAGAEKYRMEKSVGKVMYIVFWDARGILLLHQVPKGATVDRFYYSDVLENHLIPALRERRPDVSLTSLLLQHDNAPSHTAGLTRDTIDDIGLKTLNHPPYSPDLAPSDYFLFSNLKAYLAGRKFTNRSQLGSTVYQWSKQLPQQCLSDAMQKLPSRWSKCLEHDGAYFEKL